MRKQRMFVASLMALDERIVPSAFTDQVAVLVADVHAHCATPTAAQLQSIATVVTPNSGNAAYGSPVTIKDTSATSDVTAWAENVLAATENYLLGTANGDFTVTDTISETADTNGWGPSNSGTGGDMYCFDGPGPIDTTFDPVGPGPGNSPPTTGTWTHYPSGRYGGGGIQPTDIYGDPWS